MVVLSLYNFHAVCSDLNNIGYFALFSIVSAGSSKASSLPGSLQRSRSDIDVNAAAGAKAHHAAGQSVRSGRLGAGALNPGSYASLGKTANYKKLYVVFSLVSVKSGWW